MKAGVKTSEFWVSAVLAVIGSLLATNVIPADSVWARVAGAVLAAATSLGYTWSRTQVVKSCG